MTSHSSAGPRPKPRQRKSIGDAPTGKQAVQPRPVQAVTAPSPVPQQSTSKTPDELIRVSASRLTGCMYQGLLSKQYGSYGIGIAGVIGSAIHRTIEENILRWKATGGQFMTPAEISSVAADYLNLAFANANQPNLKRETPTVFLTGEEMSAKSTLLKDAINTAKAISSFHLDRRLPEMLEDIAPANVQAESRFEIDLSAPDGTMFKLTGVRDIRIVENEDVHIVDTKTGKKSKTQADADSSVQLMIYDLVERLQTGKPAICHLDSFALLAGGVKHVMVTARPFTDADLDGLLQRIWIFVQLVKADIHPPLEPDHFKCKNCAYGKNGLKVCPFVN